MSYTSKYALASKVFKYFDIESYKDLYDAGVFPINDIFKPIFTEDFDILLAYGGRGGGKSDTVAFQLIEECINSEYFNCYYGRNVFDTVRGSFHKTLITCIELLNLQNEFNYSKAPNGSLEIVHNKTGNTFIAFGGDKPDKLKSIKDPTHIIFEEADQFSLEVFTQMGATLRTLRGKNRMYLLFNTEKVNGRHWIAKVFFPELITEGEAIGFDTNKKILKIFCNYTDNYFINQESYYETLKLNSAGNQHQLEAATKGAWGVELNTNPFFYALRRHQHVGDTESINKSQYVDLSFDFNHTPMTLIVGQLDVSIKKAKIIDHISADPQTMHGKTPIEAVCELFLRKYVYTGLVQLSHIRITGDASGKQMKADRRRGEDFYSDIIKYLGVRHTVINLPRKNFLHATSYKIINRVFYGLNQGELVINSNLSILLDDLEKAYPGKNFSLDEAKKEFGLHALDAFRYLLLMWFTPKDYEKKILYLQKK